MRALIIGLLAATVPLLVPGCGSSDGDEGCVDDKGKISTENTSTDVYNIVIDGATRGKLYPGDKETFEVSVGEHTLLFTTEDGSGGCSEIIIFVEECENERWCCPECSSSGSGGGTSYDCPAGYPVDCGTYCCPAGSYCCGGACCSMF
jgi:hypothetical protein